MVEIIATLIGAAIIFSFGLWSARTSHNRSKVIPSQASIETRKPSRTEGINNDEEPNRNKIDPGGMGMAASGSKN
jgi:hypothetical protein